MSMERPVQGTLLWFNEPEDYGALELEDGQRLEFSGSAFVNGDRPVGRCAGLVVECRLDEGAPAEIALVQAPPPRRARRRRQ